MKLGILIGALATAVVALGVAVVVLVINDADDQAATTIAQPTTTNEAATTTTPEPEPEPDLVIRTTENGLQRLGDFEPQVEGITGAIDEFGQPDSRERTGDVSCLFGWDALSLQIYFAHLGGENPCSPKSARVGSVVIGSDSPEATRWITDEGLRIQDPFSRLERAYPGAHRDTGPALTFLPKEMTRGQKFWVLIEVPREIGAGGLQTVLSAGVDPQGSVASFVMFVGAAGE